MRWKQRVNGATEVSDMAGEASEGSRSSRAGASEIQWSRGDASDIMRKPRGRMKRLGKTDIEGKAAMDSAKGRARIELTSGLD